MNTKNILLAVVIIAVIGGIAFLMKGGRLYAPSSSEGLKTTQSSALMVSIKDYTFNPATVTVKQGTKVTWTNDDASIPHTVTGDDRVGPSSGMLGKGDTYEYMFTTPGTFTYYCNVHPSMHGTVVVTE